MQMSKKNRAILRGAALWSTMAVLFQSFTLILDAQYDSNNGLLLVLWWFTQAVLFPIWCISELAALIGVGVGGAISYFAIAIAVLVTSLLSLIILNFNARRAKGDDISSP